MDGNSIFAVVSFAIGLAIGLWQLYQGQNQFETRMDARVDEIRKSLTDIQQSVTVLRELNTERSFDLQDRLISIAMSRQQVINQVAEQGIGDIRKIVLDELQSAGVPDAIERTNALQKSFAQVVTGVTETVAAKYDEQGEPYYVLNEIQPIVQKLIANGINAHDHFTLARRSGLPKPVVISVVNSLIRQGLVEEFSDEDIEDMKQANPSN